MSKGNTFENDVMLKVFQGTEFSWTAISYLYVSLHTADPGEGGNQTTSEATYTGYARVAVIRTSAGWTVSGNQASNTNLVTFGQATAGSNNITHVGIGTLASGTGQLLYSGAVNTPLTVASPIAPNFPVGTLVVTED